MLGLRSQKATVLDFGRVLEGEAVILAEIIPGSRTYKAVGP
jgi:hypothetical protein